MAVQLTPGAQALPARLAGVRGLTLLAALAVVFKPRIGIAVALSALGGAVVGAGAWPAPRAALVITASVLLASFGAAGFNHYLERDLDRVMRRTRTRPFASGRLRAGPGWPLLFAGLIAVGSLWAGSVCGAAAGSFVLAGALTYVLIYTAWLKPATDWNIVIGGLAGSFGVLAGAAVVGAADSAPVLWLALVLLLWTPSHFWALAIALVDDYAAAGLPMLPVTRGVAVAARWALINSFLLVASTVGLGVVLASPLYWLMALTGGFWLLVTGLDLVRWPNRETAMRAFFASLIQLGLVLGGLFLNVAVGP